MDVFVVPRRVAFWLLDFMRGAFILKSYKNIKKMDFLDFDSNELRYLQKNAFNQLARHACETTKFYNRNVSSNQWNLNDFPIITKNDIKSNQDAFLSNVFEKKELIQMSTSGSTGTPFICYQDKKKKKRVNAEIIYYSGKVGYKVGNNLTYIRTVVKQNKKSSIKQFLQNQTLLQCGNLNDNSLNALFIDLKKVSQKGNITLLAYASTYNAIKDYIGKTNIKQLTDCKVSGVISGAEMLYDDTRVAMETFFSAPVVSRYSNEENGVIGQDEGINNVFVINEADYIVEIFDDDGNLLPNGTIGRIVVTDLYNYAMPMIRYDTGDMGAIGIMEINGRNKRVICNFSGRKVDVIYGTNGDLLSPHLITNQMWSFPDIKQFQFIQKDKHKYILKLNVTEHFSREAEVVLSLKEILGDNAQILVERVDEIPVLASGKRRYIVNEWSK